MIPIDMTRTATAIRTPFTWTRTLAPARTRWLGGALVVAMAGLAATNGAAQNNDNQVVARVGSAEITRAMLRREMPGGVDNPALARPVLEAMIGRKLLADEARRQGLDRTPIGAMVMKRADEVTAVGLLQQKFAGTSPTVSDDQANAFITSHPFMFAQRRLIELDQFLVGSSVSKSTTDGLKAANTMAQFEDVLLRDRVAYQRGATVLDTLNIGPVAAAKIAAFNPGEVFISPRPDGSLELSGVTTNTLAPITGASATRMARVIIQRLQVMQKVQAASENIVKSGQDKVKINPQFAPVAKKT